MPSILKNPTHVARLGRHGHDMSRRVLFTSSTGQLLPVLYDYLSPGDKVNINDALFTRTQPLSSPAFARINEHIEYFFVPMEQINTYFGQAFYGINDVSNTNDSPSGFKENYTNGQNLATLMPTFKLQNLFDRLFNCHDGVADPSGFLSNCKVATVGGVTTYSVALQYLNCDNFGVPLLWNCIRLMSLLGYGENLPSYSGSGGQRSVNPNLLAVYQKIYMDYYRLSQFESNNPFAYNLNYWAQSMTSQSSAISRYIPGSLYAGNTVVLDARDNLFTLRYRPLKKDFFTNVIQSPLYLLEGSFNPNSYNNLTGNDLANYSSAILSAYGVQLQGGHVGETSGISDNTNNLGVQGDTQDGSQTLIEQPVYGSSGSMNTVLSVQQMRLAYAYDKMMAITQRAGKHYDRQTKAHFGVNVPQGISGEVYFLGGHTSKLSIGEVIATAAGTSGDNNSSLGELAGRGVGVSGRNRPIRFTAPCHGYIMAIYSCCPDIEYRAWGLDRLNTYCSINDYPHPEFDNIGMQPLWIYQALLHYRTYSADPSSPVDDFNFLGWQYRWSELKMSYDRVHGAFNYSLQDWVAAQVIGQYAGRLLSIGVSASYASMFYCSPSILDGIMGLTFLPSSLALNQVLEPQNEVVLSTSTGNAQTVPDGTVTNVASLKNWSDSVVYERDPFLHSIDFKYYKTSFMSVYGLPEL